MIRNNPCEEWLLIRYQSQETQVERPKVSKDLGRSLCHMVRTLDFILNAIGSH